MHQPASTLQTHWLREAAAATDRDDYAPIPPATGFPLAARGLATLDTDDNGWRITEPGRHAARTATIPTTRTLGGLAWTHIAERTWKVFAALTIYTLETHKNIQGPRHTKTWLLTCDGATRPLSHHTFTGSPDQAMAEAAPVILEHARRNRDPLYCRKEDWT